MYGIQFLRHDFLEFLDGGGLGGEARIALRLAKALQGWPRGAKADQGGPRLAKAGQGPPRPAKAPKKEKEMKNKIK